MQVVDLTEAGVNVENGCSFKSSQSSFSAECKRACSGLLCNRQRGNCRDGNDRHCGKKFFHVLVEVSFIHACTFMTANDARYRLKVNPLSLLPRRPFLVTSRRPVQIAKSAIEDAASLQYFEGRCRSPFTSLNLSSRTPAGHARSSKRIPRFGS